MRTCTLTLRSLLLLALWYSPSVSAAELSVRIISEKTGKPVAQSFLEVTEGDRTRKLEPDDTGLARISLESPAGSSSLRITAHAPGHAPMLMRWVRDVPGEFTFKLPESEAVSGRVVDPADRPISKVRISVVVPQRLAGPFVATDHVPVQSDSDGRWRCEAVPKGVEYVHVDAGRDGYQSVSREISLESLRSGTATLVLQPVTTLRGIIGAASRVLSPDETGATVDFVLQPEALPEIDLPPLGPGENITAAASVQSATVAAGDSVTIYFKARIATGHHIYALEDSGTGNSPTDFEIRLPGGISTTGGWHGPDPVVLADRSRVYKGEPLFRTRLTTTSWMRPGKYKLPIKMTFQICNEDLCWPPNTITRQVELEVTRVQ